MMLHNSHVVIYYAWQYFLAQRQGRFFSMAVIAAWHATELTAANRRLH